MFVYALVFVIVIGVILVSAIPKSKGKKLTVISDGSRRIVIDKGLLRLSTTGGVTTREWVKATDPSKGGIYTIGDSNGYLVRSGDGLAVSKKDIGGQWAFLRQPEGTLIGAFDDDGTDVFIAPFNDGLVVSRVKYFWTVSM